MQLPRSRIVVPLLALLLGAAGDVTAQEPARAESSALFASPLSSEWPFERSESEQERPERDEIETDRDSFTPAVTTAARGRLIVESAYSFIDNRGVKETHSLPELLLRYGLTERLELRLGFNYEVGGAGNETSGSGSGGEDDFFSGSRLERESNVSYGVKLRVSEQCRWIPGSSIIVQGSTPTSGPVNDSQLTATYVFGWELFRRWKFDAALRYRTDSEGEDRFNTWAPSAVLKVPVGERINVHAEYFGLFSQGKGTAFVRQFVSPGVHYLINDNFEIGVRFGWGLNDQSSRFFTNVGVGIRF